MPFYEYECSKCGYKIEILQKINDEPLKFCPECDTVKETLIKKISQGSFRINGAGVYKPTSSME